MFRCLCFLCAFHFMPLHTCEEIFLNFLLAFTFQRCTYKPLKTKLLSKYKSFHTPTHLGAFSVLRGFSNLHFVYLPSVLANQTKKKIIPRLRQTFKSFAVSRFTLPGYFCKKELTFFKGVAINLNILIKSQVKQTAIILSEFLFQVSVVKESV